MPQKCPKYLKYSRLLEENPLNNAAATQNLDPGCGGRDFLSYLSINEWKYSKAKPDLKR